MTEQKGRQDPTTAFILPYERTEGETAARLYELSGRQALPWQRALLYDILARDEAGLWIHTRFGYSVPRRNGKGEILTMLELLALAYGERVLHTAHLTSTSHDAWRRLCQLLDKIGVTYASIKAKGQEYIDLEDGGHIEFRTRTAKGALGEGYDLLIIDEAQEYTKTQESALKYVVSASRNPHTVMCGTPPTPASAGTVFQEFRTSVLAGEMPNAGWAEWSVEKLSDVNDRELWRETNPSLGWTLTERAIADEISGDEVDNNIQRLGLWLQYDQKSVISELAWSSICTDKLPELTGRLGVGIKYGRDGVNASVCIACRTKDGRIFVEAVGRYPVRDGTDRLISFLHRLGKNALKVIVDGANGQKLLAKDMKAERIREPYMPRVSEIIQANARFEERIYQKTLLHMEQPSLAAVVSHCEHRAIGSNGGFGWRALHDGYDISLLEAAALAVFAVDNFRDSGKQKITY